MKKDRATRETPAKEPRKPLSRREYLQLMLDQAGRCGCGCGVKLDPMGEGVQDEHLIQRAARIDDPDALKNRSLWRKPCSKAKDKVDAKERAKFKRLAGETCTGPTKHPIRGRTDIPARPFDTRLTKGFDGKVRPRKQGASQ